MQEFIKMSNDGVTVLVPTNDTVEIRSKIEDGFYIVTYRQGKEDLPVIVTSNDIVYSDKYDEESVLKDLINKSKQRSNSIASKLVK